MNKYKYMSVISNTPTGVLQGHKAFLYLLQLEDDKTMPKIRLELDLDQLKHLRRGLGSADPDDPVEISCSELLDGAIERAKLAGEVECTCPPDNPGGCPACYYRDEVHAVDPRVIIVAGKYEGAPPVVTGYQPSGTITLTRDTVVNPNGFRLEVKGVLHLAETSTPADFEAALAKRLVFQDLVDEQIGFGPMHDAAIRLARWAWAEGRRNPAPQPAQPYVTPEDLADTAPPAEIQQRIKNASAELRRMAQKSAKAVEACSFCGKLRHEVQRLIRETAGIAICDDCVGLCVDILLDEPALAHDVEATARAHEWADHVLPPDGKEGDIDLNDALLGAQLLRHVIEALRPSKKLDRALAAGWKAWDR